MAKRIRVSVIKAEIDAAIAIAMRLAENRDDFRVGLELKEAEMRINACLNRVEADQKRLENALAVCETLVNCGEDENLLEYAAATAMAREVLEGK